MIVSSELSETDQSDRHRTSYPFGCDQRYSLEKTDQVAAEGIGFRFVPDSAVPVRLVIFEDGSFDSLDRITNVLASDANQLLSYQLYIEGRTGLYRLDQLAIAHHRFIAHEKMTMMIVRRVFLVGFVTLDYYRDRMTHGKVYCHLCGVIAVIRGYLETDIVAAVVNSFPSLLEVLYSHT